VIKGLAIHLAAYLLASIPTALIVSHLLKRGDIRFLGDGNMGARNVAREIGSGAGAVVELVGSTAVACGSAGAGGGSGAVGSAGAAAKAAAAILALDRGTPMAYPAYGGRGACRWRSSRLRSSLGRCWPF